MNLVNLINCFDDIDECLRYYGWRSNYLVMPPLWSDNSIILDGYYLDNDLNPDKIPF